jgi:hypothetical protein
VTSGGLLITIIICTNIDRAKPYLFAFLSILILHSLIPHKEYRFVFILIPFWLTLAASGLTKLRSYSPHLSFVNFRFLVFIFTLFSILGLLDRLPRQTQIYAQPPLLRDSVLDLVHAVPNSMQTCSLFLPDRGWVYSGGYYILHRNIPIYTLDYPPDNASGSGILILPSNRLPPSLFIRQNQSKPYELYLSGQKTILPGYALYLNQDSCPKYSGYSYIRSFNYLNNQLKSFKPYQLD